MIENKPNFLVVGTAKAGTTTLYNILSKQPSIELTSKDTFYFCSDSVNVGKLKYPFQRKKSDIIFQREEYYKQFSKNINKIAGEISTAYLYYWKEAIPKILAELGSEVKIIIILRDPVKRTFSGYTHFKRDLYEEMDLKCALEAEDKRMSNKWDFMWAYSGMSFYADAVKAYLEAFKNVEIYFFEDLIKNEDLFIKNFLNKLGSSEYIKVKNQYSNSSKVPKNTFIHKIIVNNYIIKRLLKQLFRIFISDKKISDLSKKMRDLNKSNLNYELPINDKNKLEILFKKDVKSLKLILANQNLTFIPEWLK